MCTAISRTERALHMATGMSTVITIKGISTGLTIGSVEDAIPVNDLQYTQDKSAPVQSFFVSRKIDENTGSIYDLAASGGQVDAAAYSMSQSQAQLFGLSLSGAQVVGWTLAQSADGDYESFTLTTSAVDRTDSGSGSSKK